jgi:hypothetical protein
MLIPNISLVEMTAQPSTESINTLSNKRLDEDLLELYILRWTSMAMNM